MTMYILQEGVLNDDELFIADHDKVFKGGYVAVVKYHRYLNEWNNTHHQRAFRSFTALKSFLAKNYPNFNEI